MTSFWTSDLGQLSGKAEDAFTKIFTQIPDDTFAPAEIEDFTLEQGYGKYYNIKWRIIDGDFKNRIVFQKIKAFDTDQKKQHTAKNMMMYLYGMYSLKPSHIGEPQNKDLMAFKHKKAGLRIQLTKPNDDGKQYNYVSEVHPIQGFVPKSGIAVESAFSRNEPKSKQSDDILDDVPF